MRVTASATSAPGRKKRVTSSVESTKAKARTPVKCSRSAWVSISVKWLKPATEPLTSQSTTSSGLCTLRGRWWVTTGTPPVPSEARTVLRKSSRPWRPIFRRADRRTASRRASGATVRRSSARSVDWARRKSIWSASGRTAFFATRSRPFSFAVRRRTSVSTAFLNASTRSRTVWRATCSLRPPRSPSASRPASSWVTSVSGESARMTR